MATPIITQGTIAATGAAQSLDLGFVPDIIIAYLDAGATAKPWLQWTRTAWAWRTQRVGGLDTIANGIGVLGTKLLLGTAADANVAGATLHYIAIADNRSGTVNSVGWMGSPAGWSPSVAGPYTSGGPDAVIVERDASRPPCFRSSDMTGTTSLLFDGTGPVSNGITAINSDGTINVSTGIYVNELSGGGIGEATDALSFWAKAGLCQLATWTGDGTTNRSIAHGVANAAMAIIVGSTASIAGGLKLASMGTKMTNATSTVLIDNAVTSIAGAITTGSDTRYNQSGVTYRAVVLGTSTATQLIDVPPGAGKAILIRGASVSRIDCGTDNSLSMAGAFSLEWRGRALPVQSTLPCYLMARSNGNEGRADSDGLANGAGTRLDGTWSWAIGYYRFADISDWAGPQFFICTTNYNNYGDFSGSENDIRTKPWRTGIIVPVEPFHLLVTHNGLGRWNLFMNGKLVKQRKIDMAGVTLADDAGPRVNAGAGSGHRTIFGARQGSASIGNIGRMTMRGARVYSSELTATQALAMYMRNFLGKSVGDIAPVDEWLAANASGAALAATVSAANNGTLTQSTQVDTAWL